MTSRAAPQDSHSGPYPDREIAASFIRALTGSDATPVTFQTFVDDGGQSGLSPSYFHGTLAEVWDRLCAAQEAGHGIFVMVNEGDGRGRAAPNVRGLRALFADADDAPVPVERLGAPSMVVCSGRGEHYYWLLKPGERLDAFTDAQKRIAAKLGTDPKVCDLPRVLRLPGTMHLKDRRQPKPVELVSCDATRRYSIEEVLASLDATPLAMAAAGPRLDAEAPPPSRLTDAALRAKAYIATIRAVEGDHGDAATFRVACVLLRDFALDRATAWDIFKSWNQTNAVPRWGEAELAQKFNNAANYATRPVGAALAAPLPPANEPMTDDQRGERARLIESRWRDLTPDLLDEPPLAKEFVWEDAIPVGDVGTFVGPGAAGKSATLVGLAVHMALGLPFLGRATRECQTVIVSLEDDFEDYRRKLAAWKDALGAAWNSGRVAANVFPLDLRGTDVRLVTQVGRDHVPSFDAKALARAIKTHAPRVGLIVVETVSRCGGDESNPAMSALISAAEELSSLTGSAVVLVAHVSKEAARSGNGDQHAARGGGAISDNGRFSITATLAARDKLAQELLAGTPASRRESLFVLRVAKINCAPPNVIGVIERVPSKYQTITVAPFVRLGTSKDEVRASRGEALRSLVARLAACEDVTPTALVEKHGAEMKKIGINRREAQRAIQNAVDDGYLIPAPRRGRGGGTLLAPAPLAGTSTQVAA